MVDDPCHTFSAIKNMTVNTDSKTQCQGDVIKAKTIILFLSKR
jgi:hypothetical protein